MTASTGIDGYLCRWTIDQIGTLDVQSLITQAPIPGSDSYTISFWFYAENFEGKQVLANQGMINEKQVGWSVFLQKADLCFSICNDSDERADIFTPNIPKKIWHQFVGVIDRHKGKIFGYLDGSSNGWMAGPSGSSLLDEPISPPNELIIGGYTDPAGGHFDHTFGRQKSGWIDDLRIYSSILNPKQIAAFVDFHNQPPNASFIAAPMKGEAPILVHFDAQQSNDADGIIKNYFWDFGDGVVGSGVRTKHEYRYAGEYKVDLIVLDDDHAMNQKSCSLVFTGGRDPLNFSPVFVNGEDGYACFRIPSIIRAANGDLVAFAEGRVESCSDSTQTIRAVCKRSSDNGITWSKLQVVSKNIVNGKEYVIHNISPVVDTIHGTGRIIVVYNKAEFNEWELVGGKGVEKVFYIFSDDHGKTWYGESDITTQVHKPYNPDYKDIYPLAALPENRDVAWKIQTPMLGHAIQLTGTDTNPSVRGRLLFAGVIKRGDGGLFYPNNYSFWSDDLGKSWQIGGMIDSPRANGADPRGLGEATAVELENGDLMINSRNYLNGKPFGCRAVTIGSFDRGGNISFQPTYHDEVLIEPTVQASILRYTRSTEREYGRRSRILFSNPNHPKARYNLTVRLSYDEGQTWSVSKVIDAGPSAYSDLVIQDDMKIGVLYERGNQGGISYVNFSLDWLTDGKDKLTAEDNEGDKLDV